MMISSYVLLGVGGLLLYLTMGNLTTRLFRVISGGPLIRSRLWMIVWFWPAYLVLSVFVVPIILLNDLFIPYED